MNEINLNVKFQSPIAGTCDMVGFGSCVVPAQIDPELTAGQYMYASQAVAIKSGSTYLLPQVVAHSDASEQPFGFLVTDGTNVKYAGGQQCNVAQSGAIVHFKAGEAIAAGEAVSYNIESGKMMKPLSAAAAKFTTKDLSSNVANFAAVTTGEFSITVGAASPVNYTGMNFSSAATLQAIADVIQTKLGDDYIVTLDTLGTSIVITSATAGSAGDFSIGSVAAGTGTDLTGATLLAVSAGTETDGVDATPVNGYAWTAASGDGALFRVKIAAK